MVSAQTAEVTLKGKVIDAADGYPIIGASVVLDGTKLGAITDADGNFELKIPKKKCDIVISCIGYEDEVMVYTLNNASSFGRIVMAAPLNATLKTTLAVFLPTPDKVRKSSILLGTCPPNFSIIS